MTDPDDTPPSTLKRAAEIGKRAGLKFVYAGNAPGRVGGLENTCCPTCNELLVERYSYMIKQYRITPDGSCPKCHTQIPGRWGKQFEGQITAVPYTAGLRVFS